MASGRRTPRSVPGLARPGPSSAGPGGSGTRVPDVEHQSGHPWNTFIEGDNLEVLGRLREPVDLVYIDPPYNTGNDFAYRDDFRHGDARSTRHQAWVAMMRPRLE